MNILRPVLRPVLRDVVSPPDQRSGGAPPAPEMGALEIDTFPILVDTFEIIFA